MNDTAFFLGGAAHACMLMSLMNHPDLEYPPPFAYSSTCFLFGRWRATTASIYLPLQRIDGRLADGDGWRELAADPARTTVQMDRHGRTPRRALADRAPSLSRARGRARQATWLRPPYQPRKAAGRPAVSCHCHAGGWRFYQRQRQRTERGRERERERLLVLSTTCMACEARLDLDKWTSSVTVRP